MNTASHWKSNEDMRLELKSPFPEHIIPAKSLNIVWGKDRRYWDWIVISQEDKLEGFGEGAELHQVNWLEVMGSLKAVSCSDSPVTCEVYYIIKFRVDAFGWDSVPIKLKLNGGKERGSVNLEPYTSKNDTWHEINGGEFTVQPGETLSLSFCMLENESEWWKGGMILAGVKIKPKING